MNTVAVIDELEQRETKEEHLNEKAREEKQKGGILTNGGEAGGEREGGWEYITVNDRPGRGRSK